jgi:hypothetical protein
MEGGSCPECFADLQTKLTEATERLRTHDGWCDAVGEKPYLINAVREAKAALSKLVVNPHSAEEVDLASRVLSAALIWHGHRVVCPNVGEKPSPTYDATLHDAVTKLKEHRSHEALCACGDILNTEREKAAGRCERCDMVRG